MKHIVIIGASVAGLAAARTIQALSGIRLTIVESTSDFPPYDPPRLSKEGLFDGSSLLPDTARLQFSPGSNTVVLSGVAATGLDPDIKIIHLSDGRSIHYEKLVIATGGRARQWPGANPGPNIGYLRSHEDMTALLGMLREGSSLTIVGAGLIGCEVAAAARGHGNAVSVIDGSSRIMSRVAQPGLSDFVETMHRNEGTFLRLSQQVSSLSMNSHGKVVVQNSDGTELLSDYCLVAIGAEPNTDWLAASNLTLANGVQCDETLTVTGHPDIMVAGDVARRRTLSGEWTREEHWTSALEQAARRSESLECSR